MLPGVLKAKLFLAEYGWSVVAALAFVGLACLVGAGVVLATPPTESHTVQTDQQTFSSDVTTSAVVTNGSSVWREGERIENAPVYVLSATPNLTLEQRIGVPEDQSVALNRTIAVEYRAQRDGKTFWRTRERLPTDSRNTTNGGFEANTTLDVRRIRDRRDGLERVLSDVGTVQPHVAVNVTYRTPNYSGTLNASAPLEIDGGTYGLAGGLDANQTKSTPITRTRKGSADPLVYGPLGVLGVGCLVGAALAGRLLREGIDTAALRGALHEERYAEWLSAGTIPERADEPVVWMDSLEDLVDVAIDTDKRAIADHSRGRYAVLDGDVRYYYQAEEADADPDDATGTDDTSATEDESADTGTTESEVATDDDHETAADQTSA